MSIKSIFDSAVFTKRIYAIVAALSIAITATCQAPAIQWQKSYGGAGFDGANYVRQTPDGGYIYGAYSTSTDGDVTGNHGGLDCWVVKTDSVGTIQWEHSYGGSAYEQIDQIKVDVNGGYIIAASSASNDGDLSGNHGGIDGWMLKLDDTGGIVWQRLMGSSGFDFFNSVYNTADSGYIFTGGAGANNGDISGFQGGGLDVWTVKCTKTGTISWNKTYGGPDYEYSYDIISDGGNGCYILGAVGGNGGEVTGFHGGIEDAWLLRLDDTGGVMWAKTYGGEGDDNCIAITKSTTGNYIMVGASNSTDSNVKNNHGSYDYWAVCINDTGKVLWNNCYGGNWWEQAFSASGTTDGGAILAGYATATGGEVTNTYGDGDIWVVKINDTGGLVWQSSFGGSLGDTAYDIIQTADSGYLVTGVTHSSNHDVTTSLGGGDLWAVKISKEMPAVVTPVLPNAAIRVYPTLTGGLVHVDMQQGFENATLKLTDIRGHNCMDINATAGLNRVIDLNGLTTGVYLLRVINNGQVNTYKIQYQP